MDFMGFDFFFFFFFPTSTLLPLLLLLGLRVLLFTLRFFSICIFTDWLVSLFRGIELILAAADHPRLGLLVMYKNPPSPMFFCFSGPAKKKDVPLGLRLVSSEMFSSCGEEHEANDVDVKYRNLAVIQIQLFFDYEE